ncbi:MAG: cupin domain-containing protein [bacterium]|nr:cupin domain-containing protein [bacterium]
MAKLHLEDGTELSNFDDVVRALEPLGIVLARVPLGDDPELRELLGQQALSESEKNRLLALIDHQTEARKQFQHSRAHDLVVLHPELPELDGLLAKFARCHIHPDAEIRYVVDGEGVFGVVLPDGKQVELTVEASEFIGVPKGTEHWFRLTERQQIKAVRYFSEVDSWQAEFTGTEIRFG